jgi:hypothetical protein
VFSIFVCPLSALCLYVCMYVCLYKILKKILVRRPDRTDQKAEAVVFLVLFFLSLSIFHHEQQTRHHLLAHRRHVLSAGMSISILPLFQRQESITKVESRRSRSIDRWNRRQEPHRQWLWVGLVRLVFYNDDTTRIDRMPFYVFSFVASMSKEQCFCVGGSLAFCSSTHTSTCSI